MHPVAQDRRATRHAPDELGEILARLAHREIRPRIADRRLDLGSRPHYPRIAEQPRHILFAEPRDHLGIEPLESLPKRVALAQDSDPGEPRLEPVEHQLLPQRPAVTLWHAPFLVMIGAHLRIVAGPGAALEGHSHCRGSG